jgi:endonuclease YncB( thermonuclease family)
MGLWNVRLAGLRAPAPGAPLAAVSRLRLARLAKGLRVFLVLDALPRDGTNEVVALVEDFTEAQQEAGLGWYRPEEEVLLGAYVSCRSRRAEERARQAHVGLWSDAASSP